MLEMNHIYNMDCMDGMREFPDGYFDLAIVDPPYGIERAFSATSRIKKYGQTKTANDNKPDRNYFKELFRVSSNQIIWGYNHLSDMLPTTKEFIFWYKHQPVVTYSDGELAWTSFKKPQNVSTIRILVELTQMRTGVIRCKNPWHYTHGCLRNTQNRDTKS